MCNAMQYLGKQCLEKNHPSQFEFDGVVRNKSHKISKFFFCTFSALGRGRVIEDASATILIKVDLRDGIMHIRSLCVMSVR